MEKETEKGTAIYKCDYEVFCFCKDNLLPIPQSFEEEKRIKGTKIYYFFLWRRIGIQIKQELPYLLAGLFLVWIMVIMGRITYLLFSL